MLITGEVQVQSLFPKHGRIYVKRAFIIDLIVRFVLLFFSLFVCMILIRNQTDFVKRMEHWYFKYTETLHFCNTGILSVQRDNQNITCSLL